MKIQRWLSLAWPDDAIEISVLIPCWHVDSTIAGALDSIAAQQGLPPRVHVEVILVVDGRSLDGSLIEQLIARRPMPFPFDLILITLSANLGAGMARRIGHAHSRGEFLAFLDDDDLWHPSKLALQWDWHQRYPEQICSGHGYRIESGESIDADGVGCLASLPYESCHGIRFIGRNRLLIGGSIIHLSTLMIRCSLWSDRPEPLRFGEDWLMLTMIALIQPIVLLPGDFAWRSAQVPPILLDPFSLSRQRWYLRCGKMQAIWILHQRGKLSFLLACILLAWNLLLLPRRYLLDAIGAILRLP